MVIGVFSAQLDDAYQRGLWRGITVRAQEMGHGVIGFVGQRLDAPAATEAARNIAYRLADRENIDGLIVLSSTIGTFRGIEGVRSLISDLDVPQVSIGMKVPSIPAVLLDGRYAMAELVRHVIRSHGRSRIALLAGPEGHPEAEERERVFRETSAELGYPFDERLLVRGSFLSDSGEEGARALLSRGLDFDALVCLNDRMAMGAMSVLRAAGVRIPADITVTGFDDISEARWETPPLTTVAQPLELIGRTAVEMILELLAGRPPADRVLSGKLVLRQSCGCPPSRRIASQTDDKERRQIVPGFPLPADLLERLRAGEIGPFLASLNAALLGSTARLWRHQETESRNLWELWHAALYELKTQTKDDTLLGEAHALVSSMEIRAQAAARIEAGDQHRLLRSLSARLAASFNMETMIGELSEGLHKLGIHAGFLALFCAGEEKKGKRPRRARLLMAAPSPADGRSASREEAETFEAESLLPQKYLTRSGGPFEDGTWILEPLVFQDEALGYLILEGTDHDPEIFEYLRDQVSSTLKGSLLMETITGHEQELELEVQRRTQELRTANRELRAGIDQRKLLEREVQDISDKTMQQIGQDLHDDLCQHLAGISMFVSLLETALREQNPALEESAAKVRKMLEDAVARTRGIARGLYPPGLEERGLIASLEDFFDSLTRTGKVRISLQVEPAFPRLESAISLQIFRIIQEAVFNAMKHSGTDLIIVRLLSDRGRFCAEVRDFGCGLDPLSRRADGGGMGLNTMRYRAESIGAELTMDKLDPGLRIACRWDADVSQGEAHG
jgi:DNA-binding LacI/PurR family transcriptional regulator/signal transduction histidine kinase